MHRIIISKMTNAEMKICFTNSGDSKQFQKCVCSSYRQIISKVGFNDCMIYIYENILAALPIISTEQPFAF